MKFSNNYILYPDNRALQEAISDSRDLLTPEQSKSLFPDRSVTVADNFLYTRGNFEQQRYSTAIYESLRDALESTLSDDFRNKYPLAWAETQNKLGNILAALGQHQSSAELYEEAIQHFKEALKETDQVGSPSEWATTQFNLGTANQALGRLVNEKKSLKTAVDAYTKALLVWSKDETPEQWMLAMHQLGATLHTYGCLLQGNRNLQKSVVAYKNALSVLDADNYAFELAATHNNCGAVLHNLAESEENPERLEEAIRSYEKGWKVCMEQQLPVHLAVLCRVNKTTARCVLAELTNDTVLAEEVADEFEVILECFPHALQPLCAKHCEVQVNNARGLAKSG
jgi:tetratricopeptide (TPR) repeat protein